MSDTQQVIMAVRADRSTGRCHPIWNWFGHDEPNYTYTANGKKLLRELAGASATSPHVRTHNLLTSGDGEAALKWGSTNAYSEDDAGNPIHDWTIMDRIFDAYVDAGITPFIQVGFTPEALSDDPGPYRHSWSLEEAYSNIMTGWAAPPNDLGKWYDLVAAWAQHLVDRYGREKVSAWPWECWNEPDGHYWKGTIADYCALFEVTIRAIRSVLPDARVGGPHTYGAHENPRAQTFLRGVLDHVVEKALQIDFVAFHAKGRPVLENGVVRMGLAKQLLDIRGNLDIIAEYPTLASLPVIIGESDPEGCAACSARVHPQNAYRNGPLYGVYVVESMMRTLELSRRTGIHVEGAVTWAFLFEGQPWFEGFRDLATNGVGKAVLNAFRMLGMLDGEWVATESSGALPLDQILQEGVRLQPDIDCAATRDATGVSVLVWNYHDDDIIEGVDPARIGLSVTGLPPGGVTLREYRMDTENGNAFAAWQAMGCPQDPTPEQIGALEAGSQLTCIRTIGAMPDEGAIRLDITLPRQGVGLIRIEF